MKQNLTFIVLEAKIPLKYKYDTKLEIKGKSKAHLFNQFNSIVPWAEEDTHHVTSLALACLSLHAPPGLQSPQLMVLILRYDQAAPRPILLRLIGVHSSPQGYE